MSKETSSNIGSERMKADMRQLGGLMLTFSTVVTIGSLAMVTMGVGNGSNPTNGLPLAGLIAALFQVVFGSVSMVTGYLAVVTDWGHKNITELAIILTQLAWIPYLVMLSATGKGTVGPAKGNPFIPAQYNPSEGDVKFVGTMGILSILVYAFSFVGSMAFMAFALYAYQTGKASDRISSYYRGRSRVYNGAVLLGGFSQLLLGAYTNKKFGKVLNEVISTGVYRVHFPGISVALGIFQMVVGGAGIARTFGLSLGGRDVFQVLCLVMWICMLSMQLLVQVGYAPGGNLVADAPTLGCMYLAFAAMPAILDFKMCTTPEEITTEYYGGTGEKSSGNEEMPNLKEGPEDDEGTKDEDV